MTDVRTLLDRLAAEAPSSEEVLRGFPESVYGRSGSVRRQWLLPALAVATAALVIVAGVAWSVTRDSAADPPVAEVSVPEGMRLVGARGVLLAVPADWPISEQSCGSGANSSVSFFVPITGCNAPGPSGTTVMFRRLSEAEAAGWMTDLGPDEQQGGLTVRLAAEPFRTALAVEQQDLLIEVVSPDPALAARILDSVAAVPNGWTTVPTDITSTQASMVQRLEDAGVRPVVDSLRPEAWRLRSEIAFRLTPGPGDLVREGTQVVVAYMGDVVPRGCDDTGYCPPLQANTGTWTPGQPGDGALLAGTLAFDGTTGCAFAVVGTGGVDVIWPAGWSVATSDGWPQLVDADGDIVLVAGETFRTYGAAVPEQAVEELLCTSGAAAAFVVQSEVVPQGP